MTEKTDSAAPNKNGDVVYDINLEVDSYLPHASKCASDINESTSNGSISQNSQNSNPSDKKTAKKFKKESRSAISDKYFEQNNG